LPRKFRAVKKRTPGACHTFDTRRAFGSCQRIDNLLLVLVDDLVIRLDDVVLLAGR
jgi:hypothetical protein